MSGELTITTEQVDDFPVLIAQMEHMTVPDLLDRCFPVHGNWQGLSLGWIGSSWLGHIVSVGNHRLGNVLDGLSNDVGWARFETELNQRTLRVYGTNHSKEHLPLAKAVLAYQNEYLVERGFACLKGRSLSLTAVYLQDDRRVTGLIRLLSIGLRVLTLLEFVVQRRLAESHEKLAGLMQATPNGPLSPREWKVIIWLNFIWILAFLVTKAANLEREPSKN